MSQDFVQEGQTQTSEGLGSIHTKREHANLQAIALMLLASSADTPIGNRRLSLHLHVTSHCLMNVQCGLPFPGESFPAKGIFRRCCVGIAPCSMSVARIAVLVVVETLLARRKQITFTCNVFPAFNWVGPWRGTFWAESGTAFVRVVVIVVAVVLEHGWPRVLHADKRPYCCCEAFFA